MSVRSLSLSLFLTFKGPASEQICVDVVGLIPGRVILSHVGPNHLAYKQHRIMVRSHVIVHLQGETTRRAVSLMEPSG